MSEPSNRTALVTGASRNIGRQISTILSSEVANLICCARSQKDLDTLVDELKSEECTLHAFPIDLMQNGSISKLLDWMACENLFPDIIVHSLGGSLGFTDTLSEEKQFSEVWKYNVGVGIEINRLTIPKMCEKGYGRIIHLSTLATRTFSGNLPYISAKCALEGYVKTVSKCFANKNVLINAVAPGLVDLDGRFFSELKKTDIEKFNQYIESHIATNRMVSAQEVAEAVKFLCSSSAKSMVGIILPVDGGWK